MNKTAIIRKLPSGKYRLYSLKKNDKGGRKNLGTYDSLSAAKERERQVQYFKSQHADDHENDKTGTMLQDLSDIAVYLEEAGMAESASSLYSVMSAIDSTIEDNAVDEIPDAQRNIDNEGHMGFQQVYGPASLNGFATTSILQELTKLANELDHLGNIEESDELDAILDKLVRKYEGRELEQDNVDMLMNTNGTQGNAVTDTQGSGMFSGLSDSYLFGHTGYEHLEGAYGPREEIERKLTI